MEFTSFEQKIIEAVTECKSEVKHCCENAIRHLEKAWTIREIGRDVTVFREITTEEEAAVALFFLFEAA